MRTMSWMLLAVSLLCGRGLTVSARAQQPPTAPQRAFDQYVPIDQLPATEKMPAAPFVVAAYGIVWLIAMLYLGTIWRRVNRLEGEFNALERRTRRSSSS